MHKDEAIKILARHLMQCGMMMPIEWVQKNGEGSEFMQAYEMAMNALKNEPVRCKDCKFYELKCFPDGKMKMNCENNKGIWTNTPPDAFCSYGERREGE